MIVNVDAKSWPGDSVLVIDIQSNNSVLLVVEKEVSKQCLS